ncbi:MAG: glycine cleavage system protein GcvH [Thermotogae bacterium]|nr:glycine cleavage system protein GcvH [Thermotogota bacterium]
MKVPEDLLYTKEHEWVKLEGDVAIVGITDYAQDQLGDIIYVELPEVGRKVKRMETVATVEAVKTAADVYSPLSGEVVEINAELNDHPELLNQDPYGKGWMFKLKIENPEEVKALLSPEEYQKLIEGTG